ncbi:phist protein [Plasmodium cynomolgi strain B]|uniref:Phist protein n=1 Tax=Plasmodium cynomolgi (strain B) TaxID=1120755 RepID=K6UNU0_PLACD|nr:phist protein [Plasmodium cynomolgi strain B]GAB69803.1 phist protein [Plasmodium cynomolgi strain B]
MESCSKRTVVFPVNHASTNKRNGNQNYFSTPLGGVGERSSRKSSGNFTLLKPLHILLIALLSLLLQVRINANSSEELNTTGGKAIVKESTNQDNSADSKNEEEITPDVINHLVNRLNKTRIKYDNLEYDLSIYVDDATKELTVPEKYKTKQLKKVQDSLRIPVFEFEEKIYRRVANIIYSRGRSFIEFEINIIYFRNKWDAFIKEKECIAKERLKKAMKNFQK